MLKEETFMRKDYTMLVTVVEAHSQKAHLFSSYGPHRLQAMASVRRPSPIHLVLQPLPIGHQDSHGLYCFRGLFCQALDVKVDCSWMKGGLDKPERWEPGSGSHCRLNTIVL